MSSGQRIFIGHLYGVRDERGWGLSDEAEEKPRLPDCVNRSTWVAQMLAFAHHLPAAIDRGEYRDRGDAASSTGSSSDRRTCFPRLHGPVVDSRDVISP